MFSLTVLICCGDNGVWDPLWSACVLVWAAEKNGSEKMKGSDLTLCWQWSCFMWKFELKTFSNQYFCYCICVYVTLHICIGMYFTAHPRLCYPAFTGLAGMVSAKHLKCFHKLVCNNRLPHPQKSKFLMPEYIFHQHSVSILLLIQLRIKKQFWKADMKWKQCPQVSVQLLALLVAPEYWISAFGCCVNACVLFLLSFALSYLVCKMFVVSTTSLQSTKQSYVAIEMLL